MRVKHNTLSEKEFLHLLKSGSVGGFDGVVTRANGLEDINIFRRHVVARGSGWFSNIFSKYGPKVLPFLKKYFFRVLNNLVKMLLVIWFQETLV